jgi:hypothetical protein
MANTSRAVKTRTNAFIESPLVGPSGLTLAKDPTSHRQRPSLESIHF